MAPVLPPSMTEAQLQDVWGEGRYPRQGLRTLDGIPLQVVYPGRPNTDRGPDFLGALLVFGEGPLRRGAVELHLRTADWRAHGHAQDPAYAGVILHVVAQAGSHIRLAGAPLLELPLPEDGEETSEGGAPRAPLIGPGPGPAEEVPRGYTTLGVPTHPPPGELLDALGEARLEARAAALEGDVAAVGPDQALYEELMMALGYSKNVLPFRDLARRLPLALLRELAQGAPTEADREARLAGLLFGAARLLPSQRGGTFEGLTPQAPLIGPGPGPAEEIPKGRAPLDVPLPLDGYTRRAEEAWAWLGGMEPLPEGSWRRFRVRPENHPLRRVGAAVALVLGWLREDLVERLRACVGGGRSPREAALAVVGALRTGPEGYWGLHRDFGVARSRHVGTALVGEGRAREMAVNAALPFLLALGDWVGDPTLEEAARAAYAGLPVPPSNGLARWAAGRFLPEGLGGAPITAQRQQGLLHLAKTRL